MPFFTTCGDVAPDGQFYILGAEGTGSTPAWAQIDLSDSSSPSYGNVVASGTTHIVPAVRDWAYVPGAGNFLWTYADSGASPNVVGLFRWDLTTHAFTGVRNLATVTISYTSHIGAVYATADGYLYGSDNVSGRIYRVNVTGSEPAELVSTGPQSGGNDGARCPTVHTLALRALSSLRRIRSSIIVTTSNQIVLTVTASQPSDTTVTTTVSGTAPGTSTITPPADCTHPCTTSIIVTTVPDTAVTTTMTGTVPGTSTAPSDVATTTTVFGTASGTSTITPPIDCTHPCTTSVIVTDVPSPLPCSVHGYIIQAGQNFYGIDLSTSQFSLIKSGIAPGVRGPGVINGIGYNVLDSYVYGFIRTNNDTGSVLIRIGAGGASTLIGSVVLNAANGFPAGPVNGTIRPNIGDITPDGQFWVTTGSGSAGGWPKLI
ncbi:hypothetical protein DCS_08298 [Drechmeria coniospora]|uniref:DUF6923 domain-containing protein n=1 Tax=Drechmeria coniospora TaxID=98403 RepID=A0A151GA22_DRECN|nr:uncharacterized protein DCS_08298 [Drechmeria coniospora]KYK53931.1 hypothetical protein DCS_08298 [Drechmeria coniospora]